MNGKVKGRMEGRKEGERAERRKEGRKKATKSGIHPVGDELLCNKQCKVPGLDGISAVRGPRSLHLTSVPGCRKFSCFFSDG